MDSSKLWEELLPKDTWMWGGPRPSRRPPESGAGQKREMCRPATFRATNGGRRLVDVRPGFTALGRFDWCKRRTRPFPHSEARSAPRRRHKSRPPDGIQKPGHSPTAPQTTGDLVLHEVPQREPDTHGPYILQVWHGTSWPYAALRLTRVRTVGLFVLDVICVQKDAAQPRGVSKKHDSVRK